MKAGWGARNASVMLVGIILVCVAIAISFGFASNYGLVFPDERAHLAYVKDVMRLGLPDYAHGTILGGGKNYLNHPPLYYIITGLIGHVSENLLLLRSVNITITACTVLVTLLMASDLRASATQVAFAMAVVISFPMLMLTGGSISNDPLAFLSCALFSWGLIRWHFDLRWAVYLFAVGGTIAGLTKATAALSIILLALSYGALTWRCLWTRCAKVGPRQWLVLSLALALVVAWYVYAYVQVGALFPRPGPGPAYVWGQSHPDAPRWGVLEHLWKFWKSNIWTTEKLYGHEPIADIAFRKAAFQYLILISAVLIAISIVFSRERILFLAVYLAFFAFIIAFFIEVRIAFHLPYGYPGAMQARYWFGFVPILAVIAAVGLGKLPRLAQFTGVAIAAVALSGLVLSAYSHARSEFRFAFDAKADVVRKLIPISNTRGGYVDSARVRPDGFHISGWATDVQSKEAAKAVLVFLGNRLVGIASPNLPRPDVVAVGAVKSGERAGFRLTGIGRKSLCDLNAVAIQSGGTTAPLRMPPCS